MEVIIAYTGVTVEEIKNWINYKIRYSLNIPECLEGKKDKGNVIWVYCKKDDKYFINRNSVFIKKSALIVLYKFLGKIFFYCRLELDFINPTLFYTFY